MRRAWLAVLVAALAAPAAHAAPATATWVWSDPHDNGDADALTHALGRMGVAFHRYEHLGMVAFRSDAATARALVELAGGRLDRNSLMPVHLDESVPYVGADRVKRSLGPLPAAPTVLVVDTGVDSEHPDFANLVANVRPVRAGGLVVATQDNGPVVDEAGHGTHVAGAVAGTGEALGPQDPDHRRYVGTFSNGRLASYQASSEEEGEEAQVEVVAALEAFDWALDNQDAYGIRVVTNSWGEAGAFDPASPINYASQRLYLSGMVVVFSAGNLGSEGPGHLNRYCLAPWVLCVAAGDLDGERARFSSVGSGDPSLPYDHPDVTAPGVAITSARAAARNTPLLPGSLFPVDLYMDRSGTSIAAPHVAGAAALVLAGNGALSPDQVMDILAATARPMEGSVHEVGAGYLDALHAFTLGTRTEGRLDAFLAGEEVKYAGTASGDADHAQDAVSVGYGDGGGVPVSSLARPERLWVATPVAVALLCAAAALVLAATRWRAA